MAEENSIMITDDGMSREMDSAYCSETDLQEGQGLSESADSDETLSIGAKAMEKLVEDDDDMVDALTEDSYSLLFISNFRSHSFAFALVLFGFQLSFVVLNLYDLIDWMAPENKIRIPYGVTPQVTAAQGLALILAVATQEDIINAIVMFNQGYDRALTQDYPHASRTKWMLSCTTQFVVGAGMLVVIWLLVMQSRRVLTLFLNFAALQFIYNIDDVAFSLAKRGFVTPKLQQECGKVANLKVKANKHPRTYAMKRSAFILLTSVLLVGYAIVVYRQQSGTFLCKSVLVQFGDHFQPIMMTFSGLYVRTNLKFNGRVSYVDQRTGRAMIAYCGSQEAWTLSYWHDEKDKNVRNPCGTWVARSPKTLAYDVTEVSSNWLTLNRITGLPSRADPFMLMCNDCDSKIRDNPCNSDQGTCVNNKCFCKDGFFGLNCNFDDPCEELVLDTRKAQFPPTFGGRGVAPKTFRLLRNDEGELAIVHHKPAYYGRVANIFENATSAEHVAKLTLLLFIGRRWVMADVADFVAIKDELETGDFSLSDLANFLTHEFHAYLSGEMSPYFATQGVSYGDPLDAPMPRRLKWFRMICNSLDDSEFDRTDESQPVHSALMCSNCDKEYHTCFNDPHNEFCNLTTKRCECSPGYDGVLCERPIPCEELETTGVGCLNGGVCEQFSEYCQCAPPYFGAACEFNETSTSYV